MHYIISIYEIAGNQNQNRKNAKQQSDSTFAKAQKIMGTGYFYTEMLEK